MYKNKDWYKSLKKSPISPPDWVFGVVWPILYILLAISFYLTYKNRKCIGICKPLIFFLIQLLFNLSWTTIFFRMKMIRLSFIIIIIIILLTIKTYIEMLKIDKRSAYFLIPYIVWLFFAGYLNMYIIRMN